MDVIPKAVFIKEFKEEIVRKETLKDITEYIEIFYNRQRTQERLNYLSPAQYLRQFYKMRQVAWVKFRVYYWHQGSKFFDSIKQYLEKYLNTEKKELVKIFENLWDKYKISLMQLKSERDVEVNKLDWFLNKLGYVKNE